MMELFAKLYTTCLDQALELQAEIGGWRACTQAGFRIKHCLKDLVVPIDYLLDRAYTCNMPLNMCLLDLDKAFNTVN